MSAKNMIIESLIYTLHCFLNLVEKGCLEWMSIMQLSKPKKKKQELPYIGSMRSMIAEIVAQTKVAIMENDTPETLAERVLFREHEFLVEVISSIVEGKIKLC